MCAGEVVLTSHVSEMAAVGMEGEQGCCAGSHWVCKCCSVSCRGPRALVLVCKACSDTERGCMPWMCPKCLTSAHREF